MEIQRSNCAIDAVSFFLSIVTADKKKQSQLETITKWPPLGFTSSKIFTPLSELSKLLLSFSSLAAKISRKNHKWLGMIKISDSLYYFK
ncbi:Protein of unknown function [Cotesia congregata]|uniref:Uncharacterized protein n=1 Tax=Cotesia congregata TaxID=51543 RepID=A0A8J2EBB8_COTCN|nr:Protein of unknown function [Cotesia congregata]